MKLLCKEVNGQLPSCFDKEAYETGRGLTYQYLLNNWGRNILNTAPLRKIVEVHNQLIESANQLDNLTPYCHGMFETDTSDSRINVNKGQEEVKRILSLAEGIRDMLIIMDEPINDCGPLYVLDSWLYMVTGLEVLEGQRLQDWYMERVNDVTL